MMMPTAELRLRTDCANAIRALAMDVVQAANSGHPGMPMGMADIAEALWRCGAVAPPPSTAPSTRPGPTVTVSSSRTAMARCCRMRRSTCAAMRRRWLS